MVLRKKKVDGVKIRKLTRSDKKQLELMKAGNKVPGSFSTRKITRLDKKQLRKMDKGTKSAGRMARKDARKEGS
jgi:hypothetical protein